MQLKYRWTAKNKLTNISKDSNYWWLTLQSGFNLQLTKDHIVKAMVFSSSHVRIWEQDHKEGWMLKNWCFRTVVLEKTPESPLDTREIKAVNPKGNQLWVFIGRTDAEAEAPIFWPLMQIADSLEKTLRLGKTEGRRRGRQRMGWLDGITDSTDTRLSKLLETAKDREAQRASVHGVTKSWTQLSNWKQHKGL